MQEQHSPAVSAGLAIIAGGGAFVVTGQHGPAAAVLALFITALVLGILTAVLAVLQHLPAQPPRKVQQTPRPSARGGGSRVITTAELKQLTALDPAPQPRAELTA